MKKIILIVIGVCLLTNIYSINNKQDSIYNNLYLFLVNQGDIKKEQMPKLGSDNYEEFLYIFDILKDDFPHKPNLDTQFGIYKFNYIGYIDGGYYVLIKYNESYKVYNQTSVSLIIRELIKIRNENLNLINNDLFNAYIEKIIDDKLGVYTSPVIVQKIGDIEFYK